MDHYEIKNNQNVKIARMYSYHRKDVRKKYKRERAINVLEPPEVPTSRLWSPALGMKAA